MQLLTRLFIPALLAVITPVWADTPFQISGIVSGWIYDPPSQGVRPVIGMAGGSYLGEPVGSGFDFASVAPDGKWAVAVQNGQLIKFQALSGSADSGSLLRAETTVPDLASWAADSSRVALYFAASGEILRFRVVDSDLVAEDSIDVTSLGAQLSAIAPAPGSDTLLVSVATGALAGVYVIAGNSSPVPLAAGAAGPITIANAQESYAVLFGDGGPQIWRVTGLDGTVQAEPWAAVGDGISDVAALAIHGNQMFVVARNSPLLRVIDIFSRNATADIALEPGADRLHRIGGTGMFLLSPRPAKATPAWLFDTLSSQTYFVAAREQQ